MSSELAKAKINLSLEVIGRRRDGYHELNSLVAFAGAGDRLSFEKTGANDLIIKGPFASALEGENLILKASDYMLSQYPGISPGTFTLEKNLPIASGIGGGSADAAAAIRLLASQLPAGINGLNYPELAKELGADIPVCLEQSAVIMSGIGETLTPVKELPSLPCLLINPGIPVSTGEIFRRLNAPLVKQDHTPQISIPDLSDRDKLLFYMKKHSNDLQAVAEEIEPLVRTVIRELEEQSGCLIARMSGSGATCFGIFDSPEQAQSAATEIAESHREWWVQNSVIGG